MFEKFKNKITTLEGTDINLMISLIGITIMIISFIYDYLYHQHTIIFVYGAVISLFGIFREIFKFGEKNV